MNRVILYGAVLAACLAGIACKSTYVMTLNNGAQVVTSGRPQLEGSYYVYKDINGKTNFINSGRINSIEAK